jgi:hypothetical protein
MRSRLSFLGAGCIVLTSCLPDDEARVPQAVLWLGLTGASCPPDKDYELPERDARATITSTRGRGARIKDGGDHRVECSVQPVAGSTKYDVRLNVSGGDVGDFFAQGQLAQLDGGELQINFDTGQLNLTQMNCSAEVRTLQAGVVWVHHLSCPDLQDQGPLGAICEGEGGLIFENCDR